jgi:4,5-DOPA dioxygenase extradiol
MLTPLPPLFVSHGSPMIALEPGSTGPFLGRLGRAIVERHGRPAAVLALSAHTMARSPALLAAERHSAVYDFGNFDPRLFGLRYDVRGAPDVASRVVTLLGAVGSTAAVLPQGGLDHGIWTALRYLFPQADVPVLPMAWSPRDRPEALFRLGEALAPLSREGVLVLGTGSITHNLQRVFAGGRMHDTPGTPEDADSAAFRRWWAARAEAADWPALFDYRRQAPHAAAMHPTDEHLLPWFLAAGAAGASTGAVRLHEAVTFGCLGMDAYAFGPGAAGLQGASENERASVGARP